MIKAWLSAARLRTLPLAIAGVLLGGVNVQGVKVDWGWPLALCILTAILLQVLSNFANDYGDSQNGADQFRQMGPSRAVQSGKISKEAMRRAIAITAMIAVIIGILLLWLTLWMRGWKIAFFFFLLMGLSGVAAAYFYTAGKRPYGYRGWGDVSVFVFFGIVAVSGTHFLIFQSFGISSLYLGIMQGLFSVMVLHLNNMRDFNDDLKAGKNTVAIRLGWKNSKAYFLLMIVLSQLFLGIFIFSNYQAIWLWSFLPVLILVRVAIRVIHSKEGEGLDSELKKVALFSFFIAIFLFLTTIH